MARAIEQQSRVVHGAGDFPFRSDPGRFVMTVEQFVRSTAPASWDQGVWQKRLRTGPEPGPDASRHRTMP